MAKKTRKYPGLSIKEAQSLGGRAGSKEAKREAQRLSRIEAKLNQVARDAFTFLGTGIHPKHGKDLERERSRQFMKNRYDDLKANDPAGYRSMLDSMSARKRATRAAKRDAKKLLPRQDITLGPGESAEIRPFRRQRFER